MVWLLFGSPGNGCANLSRDPFPWRRDGASAGHSICVAQNIHNSLSAGVASAVAGLFQPIFETWARGRDCGHCCDGTGAMPIYRADHWQGLFG